jgi:hypothetical protein
MDIALPPGSDQAIAQAHRDALAGRPGNLIFEVEIKRANGTIEKHVLTGVATFDKPAEEAPC